MGRISFFYKFCSSLKTSKSSAPNHIIQSFHSSAKRHCYIYPAGSPLCQFPSKTSLK